MNISLLSPFISYDFSNFRLWGIPCLSPFRFLRFWVPLGSHFGTSGVQFGSPCVRFSPLGFDLARLSPIGLPLVPFGLHLAPFGSLLAPFGSLLVPFGSLLVPLGFALVPFRLTCGSVLLPWGPLCRSLDPRRLPGAEVWRKQFVEYILNTSTMIVSNKDSITFMNWPN